jgi:hypothetical protein
MRGVASPTARPGSSGAPGRIPGVVLVHGARRASNPGRPARRGRTQAVMRQTGRTFSACGPFCPWVVSNSTFWFSASDR